MKTLLIVIVVLLVLAAVAFAVVRQRQAQARTRAMRETFGPEYDTVLAARGGDKRAAEAELAARTSRRNALEIRELEPAQREQFREGWHDVQAEFVDNPQRALVQAERLVRDVLDRRGYPVHDDADLADLTVDHAKPVQRFRSARDITAATERGDTTTEQMRQAMVDYRALFSELVGD